MTYTKLLIKKDTEELFKQCKILFDAHNPETDGLHKSNNFYAHQVFKEFIRIQEMLR